MSGKEAANFYGLSRSAFQKARQEGRIPRPTLPGKRYDRILLEMEMNKAERNRRERIEAAR
jgi:hypothetical protein